MEGGGRAGLSPLLTAERTHRACEQAGRSPSEAVMLLVPLPLAQSGLDQAGPLRCPGGVEFCHGRGSPVPVRP